jgi:predicted phosphodiesterase
MVFKSLTSLYECIVTKNSRGIILNINPGQDNFIIFSDQHKGTRTFDDDFLNNEANYVAALNYYHQQQFSFINLGDTEELWECKPDKVIAAYENTLKVEAVFQAGDKYYRTFGNHDLLWKNKLDVMLYMRKIFKMPLDVHEGIVLRIQTNESTTVDVFLTHGHQGDKMSDNNAFSTWIIAHVWAPIQRFLQINVNSPANDFALRNKHNHLMYEWSRENKNIFLVTGHTHKPVFASGKYADKAAHKIDTTEGPGEIKPTYFNAVCFCFIDGDITGIEIENGAFRLIKWHSTDNIPGRIVLEEKEITALVKDLA